MQAKIVIIGKQEPVESLERGSVFSTRKKKKCRFFNSPEGCKKGEQCSFSHEKPVCKFYRTGLPSSCTKGSDCPFRHLDEVPVKRPACKLVEHQKLGNLCPGLIASTRNRTYLVDQLSGQTVFMLSNSKLLQHRKDEDNSHCTAIKFAPALESNERIVEIATTSDIFLGYSCFFLTSFGHVYSLGSNPYGMLGLNHAYVVSSPTRLSPHFFANHMIAQVACGIGHAAMVTTTGKVYVMGLNETGQIGLPNDLDSIQAPQLLEFKYPVIQVACGSDHTILLTRHGKVYGMGCNSKSALGLLHLDNVFTPTRIQVRAKEFIVQVGACAHYSVFLARTGIVYVCGRNQFGILGLGNVQLATVPTSIPQVYFGNQKIAKVYCCEYNICFETNNGELFGTGANDTQFIIQNNEVSDILVPTPVHILQKFTGKGLQVTQVCAGSNHMLLLLQPKCVTMPLLSSELQRSALADVVFQFTR